MDEDRTSRARRSWKLICLLAVVSGLASLSIYLVHVPDFFMGDDFELAGDALAGTSPFRMARASFGSPRRHTPISITSLP